MKHNLPAPSQAWGSDVDRRLAALESQVRLYDNKLSNSVDAVSALTQRVSANGVAQPFSFTESRGGITFDGGNQRSNIFTRSLDWGEAGSFMLVAISGFVTAQLRDGVTPLSSMFSIETAVLGTIGYGRVALVPTYGQTLGAAISYTTLVEYNERYNPCISISLTGLNPDNYLVSGAGANVLQVTISGVRY